MTAMGCSLTNSVIGVDDRDEPKVGNIDNWSQQLG
jgi:hypothetical protein